MPKCIAALFGYAQNLLTGLFRPPRGRHSTRHDASRTSRARIPRIPRGFRTSRASRRLPHQWLSPLWGLLTWNISLACTASLTWTVSRPRPTKRQRSRRVRPFAPEQPPEPLSVPAQPAVSAPVDLPELPDRSGRSGHPALPASSAAPASERTHLASPKDHVPADELALVRPYYAAYERTYAQHEAERRQRSAADRLTAWGADLGTLVPPRATPASDALPAPTPAPVGAPVSARLSARPPLPLPTRAVRVRPGRIAPRPSAEPIGARAPRLSAGMEHRPHLSRLRRQQQRRAQEVAV